jgi:response regulator NasT
MFTQDDDGATIARATRAGVSAYVVDGISKKRVRPILDAAIERFQQFRGLAEELEKTRAQLEERRVVDKAKSILMKQRVMSEDEASKALRSLAMSSNKRLAQVAESDVDAAKLLL